ncbi:hypothetical protein BDY21DRAFT_369541 [Lineolata rhizophorae]|uniref:Uncharacterized protein n=1 Tax=Lineolata rhizophorae TaxID=578093 RepID=A0A6A6P9I7_9PEZI|nr:hypothetical protein BDY21DRAFT_369541 [Lineolata rhizophorae]
MKFAASLVVAFAFAPLAYAQQQGDVTNCTIWEWDKTVDGYIEQYPPRRVSAGETCTGSRNCAISASGVEMYDWTKNVSGLPYGYFQAVQAGLDEEQSGQEWSFNDSVLGTIENIMELSPGTSAYMNFSALRYCYVGTTQNCTGAVENRTRVEVCEPMYRSTQTGEDDDDYVLIMGGSYVLVNISREEVDDYDDPYANLVRSGAASAWYNEAFVAAVVGLSWFLLL